MDPNLGKHDFHASFAVRYEGLHCIAGTGKLLLDSVGVPSGSNPTRRSSMSL